MAINEGFEDRLDPAEELLQLVNEQAVDRQSSCGEREYESLFDPKNFNKWSSEGRVEATDIAGFWVFKV